jgi:AP2-associated kinase
VLRAGAAGWKLCDYGSATLRPPGPASARERGQLEDVILRRTTPAYRAPEMWDLFRNATLGPAADVWALGCLLGVALGAPPFGPDDKLRMLSATFRPPLRASPAVAALQQRALALSPDARPTAVQLLAELDELLAAGAAAPPQAAAAAPPPLPPRAPPPLPAKPHAAGVDPAAGLSAADAGWTASFD